MRYLLVVAVALLSCRPTTPTTLARCNKACEHLVEMGCPTPGPQGTSCEAFCSQVELAGHRMPTECVTQAATCEQADECS